MAKSKKVSVIVIRPVYLAGDLVGPSDKPITISCSIAVQLVEQGKCRWPDAQPAEAPAKKKSAQADV